MKDILDSILPTSEDTVYDDVFCVAVVMVSMLIMIACIVLSCLKVFDVSDEVWTNLRKKRVEIIVDYIDRIDKEKAAAVFITDAKLRDALNATSVVPMVYKVEDSSNVEPKPVETPVQKVEVKNMPNTLKAIPGKPLSSVPANTSVVTYTSKGPTYTWRSSGKTVTVTYPDGTTTTVDKRLLKDLLGGRL
jgi:hypothetical protein